MSSFLQVLSVTVHMGFQFWSALRLDDLIYGPTHYPFPRPKNYRQTIPPWYLNLHGFINYYEDNEEPEPNSKSTDEIVNPEKQTDSESFIWNHLGTFLAASFESHRFLLEAGSFVLHLHFLTSCLAIYEISCMVNTVIVDSLKIKVSTKIHLTKTD